MRAAEVALAKAQDLAPGKLTNRVASVLDFVGNGAMSSELIRVLTRHPSAYPDVVSALELTNVLTPAGSAKYGHAMAELWADGILTPNGLGIMASQLTRDWGHTVRDQLHFRRRDLQAPRPSIAEEIWLDGARAFAAEELGDRELASHARAGAMRRYQALQRREAATMIYLIELLARQ